MSGAADAQHQGDPALADRKARAYAALAAAFENAPDAMAILDARGVFHYSNNAFRAFYETLPQQGSARVNGTFDLNAFSSLKELLTIMLRDERASGLPAYRAELILRRTPTQRLVASISAISASADWNGRSFGVLALLVIRDSMTLQTERISAVQRLFNLTATETRVLGMFARGADLSQVAREFGVTIHTARAHMKALLSKTGCRRQANLAQLIETTPTGSVRVFL